MREIVKFYGWNFTQKIFLNVKFAFRYLNKWVDVTDKRCVSV